MRLPPQTSRIDHTCLRTGRFGPADAPPPRLEGGIAGLAAHRVLHAEATGRSPRFQQRSTSARRRTPATDGAAPPSVCICVHLWRNTCGFDACTPLPTRHAADHGLSPSGGNDWPATRGTIARKAFTANFCRWTQMDADGLVPPEPTGFVMDGALTVADAERTQHATARPRNSRSWRSPHAPPP